MKKQIIAKAIALSLVIASPVAMNTAAASGIPVSDGANMSQTTMSAIENIAQTLKQIEQYRTQLQQYENQLKNTVAPAAYIWDQASSTITDMRSAVAKLQAYRNQLGNIDSMLEKYQSVDFYKNSPCFTSKGCSAAERAQLAKNQEELSKLQKLSNDGLLKSITKEVDAISKDANTLGRLQRAAQSAGGQMEALQYANQLSSAQANQLLQLRNMINTEMQANAAYRQGQLDRQAQHDAARKEMYEINLLNQPYKKGK